MTIISHRLCNDDNREGDILVHLLAGHVQLHVQSHDLLLHEPEVTGDFRCMMILAKDTHLVK